MLLASSPPRTKVRHTIHKERQRNTLATPYENHCAWSARSDKKLLLTKRDAHGWMFIPGQFWLKDGLEQPQKGLRMWNSH